MFLGRLSACSLSLAPVALSASLTGAVNGCVIVVMTLFSSDLIAAPSLNLIDESSRLQVLQEETIQKEVFTSRRTYSFGYANMAAKKMDVVVDDRVVRYDELSRPAVTGGISYYPVQFYGLFGITGNVTYSYGEKKGFVKTALHWAEADIALAYRYERTTTQWIKPFVTLGAGYNVLVQRGASYFNTSEARGVGIGTLGVNLNLNRTFAFNSPLMWELTARYRRIVDNEDVNLDFNGEHYALGLELAL